MKRSAPLRRTTPLARATSPRRRAISPASPAQRDKADAASIISGEYGCDPAHIWPRGLGGCDSPLCVVPLTRAEHRAYDDGRLDLLPHLIAHGLVAELAHALEHARGDLIGLLNQITGERWAPERRAA